jgi:hypothetical protein
MNEPRVTVRQEIAEVDGEETGYPRPILLVETHGGVRDWIVLTIGGHRYTVRALDLADAAERARGRP